MRWYPFEFRARSGRRIFIDQDGTPVAVWDWIDVYSVAWGSRAFVRGGRVTTVGGTFAGYLGALMYRPDVVGD